MTTATLNDVLQFLATPSKVEEMQNALAFLVPPICPPDFMIDGRFGAETGKILGMAIMQNKLRPKHRVSDRLLKFVAEFEGFEEEAYLCPSDVWTVGYGHTDNVREGDTMSQETALEVLRVDLRLFESHVERLVDVSLTQSMFDALVSFVFNIGDGAFEDSTLLRVLNRGKYREAADQFSVWIKGGGVTLPGLVRRRAAEREMFLDEMA